MALINLGGMPLVAVGHAGVMQSTFLPALGNTTIDAANEAAIHIGQVYWDDGGSHTLDTTGSSSIQWRSNSATFANAGTTLVVGIAALDTANGPAMRAVNVADVITFDVSCLLTGGGGGVGNGAWNTTVPTSGTKTIATGDLVAVAFQMVTRAGADTINVAFVNHQSGAASQRPTVSSFVGGSYVAVGGLPNIVLVASDGTLGFLHGAGVWSTLGAVAFNSGSSPNERGNLMTLPVAGKSYGFIYSLALAGATSDFDLVLYSDPLGTPAAEKTVSFDGNNVGSISGQIYGTALFASPYTFTAGQVLAAIYKPTTANNITASGIILASSAHMKAWSLGTGAYAVNRSSGAFGVQNSNLDRYQIGLLISAASDGAGSSYGMVG